MTGSLGTVVISGASSGIGEATARHLAMLGYRVLAGVRTSEDYERLRLMESGIEPVILDITDAGHVQTLVDLIEATEPNGLYALINNAGVAAIGPVELLDEAQWRTVIDVNVHGTIALTRALLPSLLRAGGRLINISSGAGRVALPLFAPYAASKFAMEAFNDALRREVEPLGVRVVCIAPGAISSPIFDKHLDSDLVNAPMGAYDGMFQSALVAARQAKVGAPPPSKVAPVVGKALGARRPRPRYAVGWDSRAASLGSRVLPTFLLDAAIRGLSPRDDRRQDT